MKLRFLLLTCMLLFSRGCDFYSTSLWFSDSPADETNPLTQIFGFGWTGLILTNILIVGLIIYGFYYYTFKYSIRKPASKPEKLSDFVSESYFNEKGKLHQLFYKIPKNKKIFMGHTGYILIRVLIIASLLATIHNLGQFHQIPAYQSFRELVGRPLFVIYGLILLSIGYFSFRLWKSEYDFVRQQFAMDQAERT